MRGESKNDKEGSDKKGMRQRVIKWGVIDSVQIIGAVARPG